MSENEDDDKKVALRAPVPINMGNRGMVIQSFDELVRFGQYCFNSRFVPDGVKTFEGAVVIMQYGMERGLSPMTALQNVYVVNGRPAIFGDAGWALIKQHPAYRDSNEYWEGEGDNLVAVCELWIHGKEKPIVRRYSWKDAVTAGHSNKGTYKQNPKRMLQWRARWWAGKDAIPEALMGMLTVEEAEELPPIRVENEYEEPVKIGKMAALVGKITPPDGMKGVPDAPKTAQDAPGDAEKPAPATKSTTTAKPQPAASKPAPAPDPEPEPEPATQEEPPFDPDGEPEPVGRQPGEDDDEQPEEEASDNGPVTDGQTERILQLKREKTVAPKQFAALMLDVGNEEAKMATLTSSQADELIAALEKLK